MKHGQYPKTEAALVSWMQGARPANISLCIPLLKIKAKSFSEKVGEPVMGLGLGPGKAKGPLIDASDMQA